MQAKRNCNSSSNYSEKYFLKKMKSSGRIVTVEASTIIFWNEVRNLNGSIGAFQLE